MNEFEMIYKYCLPLTMEQEEAGALKDDAAVLQVPDGYDLVVSSDTLNAGTHFVKEASPYDIAQKCLRVNLSDIAAMGAKPYCYQLNIALPGAPDEDWLKDFTAGLLDVQKEFGIFCSGGDTTTCEGGFLVSMTITGLVPKGGAVTRSGAKPGDVLVVTGPVGQAAAGLKILFDLIDPEDTKPFLEACYKPRPRTALHEAVSKFAHAAIDISDGLVADAAHICNSSGVRGVIQAGDVPVTAELQQLIDSGDFTLEDALTGGDDYELLLAIAPGQLDAFMVESQKHGVNPSVIGVFESGAPSCDVLDENGQKMDIKRPGWTHF